MFVQNAVGHVHNCASSSPHRSPHPDKLTPDEVWQALCVTLEQWTHDKSRLSPWLLELLSDASDLSDLISIRLARCYGESALPPVFLKTQIRNALNDGPELIDSICADLSAIAARDPAANDLLTPFLFFKGFLSTTCYRCAHHYWCGGDHPFGLYLQHRISAVSGIDIHPAASIGRGVLMDHGTGIVIGETAVVHDDVTLFHNVTLGGTGKERGDRHPKVKRGAFLGAGATILGNISIGEEARIAAGSVVLRDVPPRSVVVGTLATIKVPALSDARSWANETSEHSVIS
jgi:serine O-acetyltransferase